MNDLGKLVRVLRVVAALGIMGASAFFAAQAFAQHNAPLMFFCSLLALSLLLPVSHATAEGLEELWRWNEERSLLPSVARDVLRVINRHLMQLAHWKDSDNAKRGAFDPVVEKMIEEHRYPDARKYASERLWSAHCSGDRQDERMYRRYMHVIDRMREAA